VVLSSSCVELKDSLTALWRKSHVEK